MPIEVWITCGIGCLVATGVLMYPWALMIASAAMSAAGTGAQMAASAQQQRAMRKAVDDQVARQRMYANKLKPVYEASKAQAGAEVAEQQMGEASETHQKAYEEAQVQQMAQYSPQERSQSESQRTVEEMREGRSNTARAGYMAQPEWVIKQRIKDMMANYEMAPTMQMAREYAGLMPYHMLEAQQQGSELRTLGGVMSSLGALGGTAAALGYGDPTLSTEQARAVQMGGMLKEGEALQPGLFDLRPNYTSIYGNMA